MKQFAVVILAIFCIGCTSEEGLIKQIIDDSYFGPLKVIKVSDVEKLKEDIYVLSVHPSMIQEFAQVKEGNEYRIVRYIFKSGAGVFRIFYIIDFTDKYVVDKSSDPEAFYLPIARKIFGKNRVPDMKLEGDYLVELMRLY